MKFDELFENRSLIASKLKDCIREARYTKVAFAKKANISRPTPDKILNGNVDNKNTFDHHLQKILGALNLTIDDFLFHTTSHQQSLTTIDSNNALKNHKMSIKTKKQIELLLDVIDLCTIYY